MTRSPSRGAGALAPLVFVALAVALFPGATLGGKTLFFYDTGLQNLTFRAWWFEQLRAGHFATWCPGMFAGYPLFAETQTGPLYPPTFLLFSLLPATAAFSWSVALHFAFAGLGAYRLARRAGADRCGAVLAGVAFEGSGFLVAHVVHFNLLTGAAWAPWVGWLALRAGDGRPRDALLLAGAFACLLLGAHPYATLMCALLAALLVAARAGASAGRLAVGAAGLALVVAVGAAIAAVQVLPARELIARSPRAGSVDWSFLTFGSFGPWAVPTLISPDLFGTPVDGTYWAGPDWSHFAETCVFAGAVAVALAVAALVLRHDLVTVAMAGTGTLAFVLMLGRFTPLYHVLAWIPVVKSTRLPARFSLLLALALAILAGLGLDALRREPSPRRRRIAAAAGAAAVLALAVWAHLASAPAREPDPDLSATGRAWAAQLSDVTAAARAASTRTWIAAAAALVAIAPFARRRAPGAAGVIPIVILGLDLLSWGRAFNPVVPAEVLQEPPPAVAVLPRSEPRPRIFRQGLDEIWSRQPGIPRTDLVTPAWRGRESSYSTATWALPPNSQLLWDVDSGEGFTSLPPVAWLEWMGLPDRPGASPRPDLTEAQADLLSLDAVLSSGAGIDGAGWAVTPVPGDLFVSRNLDPLPRARWASSWTVLERGTLLSRVRSADHEPRMQALLESAPAGWPDTRAGGRADEPAAARETAPGRWEVQALRDEDSIVVLSESWDPGWKALATDGRELTVLRVDGLFTGVAVPRGVASVTLRYFPSSVQMGAWVSIAVSLLCVSMGFLLAGRSLPSFPSERRAVRAGLAVALPAAGVAFAVACVAADVGDVRRERELASLPAAAARSWSAEALGALRAGVPAEAARLLRAAMRADPGDPVHAYRLGLAERESGRPDEARAAFRRALAIDAGFAPAREALDGPAPSR